MYNTKEEIDARIKLLSSEMDANGEENQEMQEEIDQLYQKLREL